MFTTCFFSVKQIKRPQPGWVKLMMGLALTGALLLFLTGIANAQAPVISPKNHLVFTLDSTGLKVLQPSDVVTIGGGANALPFVKISPNTFDCSSLGKQTITVTASNISSYPNDASNTSTQKIDITIASTPIFANYDDVILTADADCKAVIPDYASTAQVTDLCPNVLLNVTQEPAAGTALTVNKPATISLTARDKYGGATTIFFTVTSFSKPVIDPVKTPITFKLDENGNYDIKLSDLAGVSTCDDGDITTTISPPNVTCADVGKTSITLTASTSRPNPRAVTFSVPTDVVTDAQGNLYIADGYSCKIRKIATDGTVTTFAGGDCGFADGIAPLAKFGVLNGLTIDPLGNLYVVDKNSRIRKVTTDGTVTTLAGNGQDKSVDGNGAAASFRDPRGITIDAAGNLFVTQGTDYLIRKISPFGIVTTVTPPASAAKLYVPTGITVDAAGNLYVTDFSSAVKKISPKGDVTIVAGHSGTGADDGKGNAASFNNPKGITFDKHGDLYVTDSENNAIRKIDPLGNVTTLDVYIAGTGNKALLNNPVGIKLDLFDNFIVVDSYNERLVRITPTGDLTLITGNGVVGNHNGNANTPPTVGIQTTMSFPVTVLNSLGSDLPAQIVTPAVTVSPQNATACAGDPISFNATIQPTDATIKYEWLVNGVKAGTNSAAFTSTKLNDGDMVTCITSNNVSCILPKSSDPIMVHINPLPQINFPDKYITKPGKDIQLQPVITGDIMSYRWSPSLGLSDTTTANPVASPLVTTVYHLQAISTSGCTTDVPVTVNVVVPIDAPNSFSPNGDGVNDFWEISSLQYYPNCLVGVYNRYGQAVFYSKGYHVPWDGRFNGGPLAEGTYYYIIAPNNGTMKPVSGWVMIIR